MKPERLRRATSLFRAVMDKPPAEREAHLARLSRDDPALHARIRRLVDVVEAAGRLSGDVTQSLLMESAGGEPADVAQDAAPGTGTPPHELRPQEMLGRYRILGEVGQGGMSHVWGAQDTSLEREVAIKFLPPDWAGDPARLKRFRQEARVLASLNHPNIVTVYAVEEIDGKLFIVMEMVKGRSLRENIPASGLPFSQLLEYAISIADALAAAHSNGITHHDLKPENIMVTHDNRIKVLDFGLAMRTQDGPRKRRAIVGTPSYMSPEQLRAETTDPRSDVFSFGMLLYEMATGRRPFAGDTLLDTVSAILRDPAPPPSEARSELTPEFDVMVAACLEKDSARRPPSVRPILASLREIRRHQERAALWSLAATGSTGARTTQLAARTERASRSLAVIPFEDLSPEADKGHLCVGIAEEIATALTRFSGLRVTVVSRMDREVVDSLEMARALQADAFLDGHIVPSADGIEAGARLVKVDNGEEVWSARFRGDSHDLFSLRDDVVGAIATAFQIRPEPASKVPRKRDPAAHAAYLKGRFFWGKRYEGGLRRALECFDEAIALDDGMAPAHAGRADCFLMMHHYGLLAPERAYSQARAAVERALALDRDLAEAHASMGWMTGFCDWKWADARKCFERALELDPAYATAWEWNGMQMLSYGSRTDGIASLRQAQRRDPVSLMISSILGWALYCVGQADEGDRLLRNVVEMDPQFVFAHTILSDTLANAGDLDGAVAMAERGALLSGREGLSLALLGYAHGRAGRIEETDRVVAELEATTATRYVSPFHLALCHLGAGRLERALDELERGVEGRDAFLASMHFDPTFDTLRECRRFQELLARMNLDPTENHCR